MPPQLPEKILCLVTDRTIFDAGRVPPEARLLDAIKAAVRNGVNMVQLRERGLPTRDLFSLSVEIRRAIGDRALFIVNDRTDIALAARADGVQLGEQSMNIRATRSIAGDLLLIGRSVHDEIGAADAERDGADFLVAGTIFDSRSHPGLGAAGTGLISAITRGVSVPVVGIGGIRHNNAEEVMTAGASGIGVISAILDAVDHGAASRRLAQTVGIPADEILGESEGRNRP